MTPTPDIPSPDAWRRALTGDRDAFEEAVAPHQERLMRAARRLLDVRRDETGLADDADPMDTRNIATGDTARSAADLTPEELVGETLVQAYERRASFDPEQMGFRAWLLGLQTRSLARFTRQESLYAQRKAISLDEEVPTDAEGLNAVGEQFYEFRQPFDVTTYEDIIAGSTPRDVELPEGAEDRLSEDELAAIADADLGETARHALLLHDEFEVSLPEVAQILDTSLKEMAEEINLARANLRTRIGSTEDLSDADRKTDSYTGDPLPDA